MPTKVVNLRDEPYDVYIGRGSMWGNQWSHLAKSRARYRVATREEAIRRHREWVLNHPEIIKAIRLNLKGKVLGCFCKPLSCHGDTYVEIANENGPIAQPGSAEDS